VKDSKKLALITGITGQDGSYLAELLLEKGYTVHGIVRRTSNLLRSRIEHLRRDEKIYGRRLFLHYGDLSDSTTLSRVIADVQPMELYHLAGQSHVGLSFEIPESTCEEVGMATLRLLEIVRSQPQPLRLYHASSSEIFGHLRFPKPRARRCSLRARMDALRLSRHNWRERIGNRMASLFVTAFFTTTNRRGAEKTL
jgi:GDP-mannose 4,6-dehydratase